MPGYEPFLLCDFHVAHDAGATAGCASARSSICMARPARFDVIAITDHILMRHDRACPRRPRRHLRPARASPCRERFADYLGEIAAEAQRARRALRDAGHARAPKSRRTTCAAQKNSHIIALDIREYISADQPPTTS